MKKIIYICFLLSLIFSITDLYQRESHLFLSCSQEAACTEISATGTLFTQSIQKYYTGSMGAGTQQQSIFLILIATALVALLGYMIRHIWLNNRQQSDLMYWGSISAAFSVILLAVTVWSPGGALATLKHLLEMLAGIGVIALLYRVHLGLRGKRSYYPGDYSTYKWLPRLALFFLSVAVVSGGWLGGNFAGYSCNEFLACFNEWLQQYSSSGEGAEVAVAQGQLLSSAATRDTLLWLWRAVIFAALLVMGGMLRAITRVGGRDNFLFKEVAVIIFLIIVQLAVTEMARHMSWSLSFPVFHHLLTILLFLFLIHLEFHVVRSKIRSRDSYENDEEKKDSKFVTKQSDKAEPVSAESMVNRLQTQLSKTRRAFASFSGFDKRVAINDELFQDIEDTLLMADMGISATEQIMSDLKQNFKSGEEYDSSQMIEHVRVKMNRMIHSCSQPLQIDVTKKPFVILVVGVNGVGKTTTIGKLARRFKDQGQTVMLAAGDTFRAAAVEQLKAWGERNEVAVVAQHTGADSASVVFDALESAKSKSVDVLIADTAGRLHTKSNLMDELGKIKRIMKRLDDSAPHEVLLVLDAGTGQNALSQATQFNDAVNVTGIALTKLDGTAKGGVVFGLADSLGIPIRFVGIGESAEDLRDFDGGAFVDAILPPTETVHSS